MSLHPNLLVSVILPSYMSMYEGSSSGKTAKLKRAINSFLIQTRKEKELILISDGCVITENIYKEHYAKHPEIKFKYILKQDLFSGTPREEGIKIATGHVVSFLDADDVMESSHLDNIATGFLDGDPDWVYFNDFYKTCKDSKKIHIPREVLESSTFYKFRNKTNREIITSILQDNGYRLEQGLPERGGLAICKNAIKDTSDRSIKGTAQFIINKIQSEKFCNIEESISKPREVALCENFIGISSIAYKRELNVSWKGCDGRGHEWQFINKLIKASVHRKKIYNCGYIVCHIKDKTDY